MEPKPSPAGSETDLPEIPGVLPIIPVDDLNIFPRMIHPLLVVEPSWMAVVQDSLLKARMIALFLIKGPSAGKEAITGQDLHEIGMAAYILRMSRGDDGPMRVLTQGLSRIRLLEIVEAKPILTGRVETISEAIQMDQEIQALLANARGLFKKVLDLSPNLPDELKLMNQNIDQPGLLADVIASALNLKKEERQDFLATVDIKKRLEKVLYLLERQVEILELGSKIQSQIKGRMDKSQREYFLREQLKAIQEELGEKDEASLELEELARRLDEKNLPEEIAKTARKELDRLKHMNPASAEHTVARTYLDWILDLPWTDETQDRIDLVEAQGVLDNDHFDLEKVKKRIIEYLAVRRLKPDMKGPILCFVGPPGTGKTSLGRSIARALGRNFVRISLGGIRDEAEIRGHRRTYVGALPGRIIQGLKKAGSRNPVFMLDEVDKLGADFRGDPSSALLEVLDPEQNFSFSDHYLEVAFDLSKVMFIATANILDTVPGPLRDRMEVITLSGYTSEEKLLIAKRYLVPRQLEAHGLKIESLDFRDSALKGIIADYTREAGLRNLEREIGGVCRAVATEVAKGKKRKTIVKVGDLQAYLGPPKFESEVRARTAKPGVATGLAWTQVGGDILFIEATGMPGKGGLLLTGQLGEVMKESAQAALSYVRSRGQNLGLSEDYFSRHDLHIHVPAGAIPKDGPSAGVTMVSALASLVTNRPVKPDMAMTGEITLRGLVLPVGGIKEKVLAAKRAGIRHVILPKRNEKDFEEITESLRQGLVIHPVETIDQALELVLKKNRGLTLAEPQV
ncbi:MAG: endopeptidase La [Thermodesulfobacteriota bacterium]